MSVQQLENRSKFPACSHCCGPCGEPGHQLALLDGCPVSALKNVKVHKVGLPKLPDSSSLYHKIIDSNSFPIFCSQSCKDAYSLKSIHYKHGMNALDINYDTIMLATKLVKKLNTMPTADRNQFLTKTQKLKCWYYVADSEAGNGVIIFPTVKNDKLYTGATFKGERVISIDKDSPAEKAGLQVGDIIQTVADIKVSHDESTTPENLMTSAFLAIKETCNFKDEIDNGWYGIRFGLMRSNVAKVDLVSLVKSLYQELDQTTISFEEFSKILTYVHINAIHVGIENDRFKQGISKKILIFEIIHQIIVNITPKSTFFFHFLGIYQIR